MTAKEASQKWNMTEEQVRNFCKTEKIPGAQKVSGKWQIPDDAQNPKASEKPVQEKSKDDNKSTWYLVLGLLGVALSLLGGESSQKITIYLAALFC